MGTQLFISTKLIKKTTYFRTINQFQIFSKSFNPQACQILHYRAARYSSFFSIYFWKKYDRAIKIGRTPYFGPSNRFVIFSKLYDQYACQIWHYGAANIYFLKFISRYQNLYNPICGAEKLIGSIFEALGPRRWSDFALQYCQILIFKNLFAEKINFDNPVMKNLGIFQVLGFQKYHLSKSRPKVGGYINYDVYNIIFTEIN